MTDRITDLFIEFDEMGFIPTTLCPKPEEYAIEWREQMRKEFDRLTAENAALRERLKKTVELPCTVGDTIYEVTSVGIYEWEVESVYLSKKIFQANCVNKNDYKIHWNFKKDDYCNAFEGKGRVRVNRLEAEARLKELKEKNND